MPDLGKVHIFNLNYQQLLEQMAAWDQPGYRAAQLWQGLYQHLYNQPEQFTSFPQTLRRRLEVSYSFSSLQPHQNLTSTDGETRKTLFLLPDGQAIEAVRMSYDKRQTLCISTQAGCAMGCVFCATGQMGFRRHLTSGEIVEQVLFFERLVRLEGKRVSNVVIMGMGEPLHNYENTMAAIDRLNDPQGFNFGARRFTISTVGLVPAIRRFTSERRQVNLAVSLHAAEDDLRTSMLPINKRYNIDEVLSACRDYVQTTHRRVTFEWALIHQVNDSLKQARVLAKKLDGILCHVNIIPLNPTQAYDGQATSRSQALAFQAELVKNGIPCTIRLRRGIDIQAGCGQLAIQVSS